MHPRRTKYTLHISAYYQSISDCKQTSNCRNYSPPTTYLNLVHFIHSDFIFFTASSKPSPLSAASNMSNISSKFKSMPSSSSSSSSGLSENN
mmetsp:Transcript_30932/g.67861  ORF Transcript_30932/g.67861 Transcript_30932/m.67861 type:complete len:92 (+) Transcript_30932:46-321(+)